MLFLNAAYLMFADAAQNASSTIGDVISKILSENWGTIAAAAVTVFSALTAGAWKICHWMATRVVLPLKAVAVEAVIDLKAKHADTMERNAVSSEKNANAAETTAVFVGQLKKTVEIMAEKQDEHLKVCRDSHQSHRRPRGSDPGI